MAWPAGPRPKQAVLYPRRLWIGKAVAFALGAQLLAAATLAANVTLARAGAALLVAAVAALAAAARALACAQPLR